jgi:hypothetical protein
LLLLHLTANNKARRERASIRGCGVRWRVTHLLLLHAGPVRRESLLKRSVTEAMHAIGAAAQLSDARKAPRSTAHTHCMRARTGVCFVVRE